MYTYITILGNKSIKCKVSDHREVADLLRSFFSKFEKCQRDTIIFKGSSVARLISDKMVSRDFDVSMGEEAIENLIMRIGGETSFDIEKGKVIIEKIIVKPEYGNFSTITLNIIVEDRIFLVDISNMKARLDFGFNGFTLHLRYPPSPKEEKKEEKEEKKEEKEEKKEEKEEKKEEKEEKKEEKEEKKSTYFEFSVSGMASVEKGPTYEIMCDKSMLSEFFSFIHGYHVSPLLIIKTMMITSKQLTMNPRWGKNCCVILRRMDKAFQKGAQIRGFLPFYPSYKCGYCRSTEKAVNRFFPTITHMEPADVHYHHDGICVECFFKLLSAGVIKSCRLNLGFHTTVKDDILHKFFKIVYY